MSEFDELTNEMAATTGEPNFEPSPVPLTQEQILEKLKLKSKIFQYRELFPKQLLVYDYKFADFDSMSIAEIQELLIEIQFAVSSRNSAGFTKQIYFSGVQLTERFGTMLNFQLQGLENALQQSQEVHDCLNELSLKYEDMMFMPPEMRLLHCTLQTALALHKVNSSNNTIKEVLSTRLAEDVQKKYEDL